MTIPSFQAMPAAEVLDILHQTQGRTRKLFLETLLYSRGQRPRDILQQQVLFLGLLQDQDIKLSFHDRINVLVAVSHKSVELQDHTMLEILVPQLHIAFGEAATLPWQGPLRASRTHVTFSVGYVSLLAALFLRPAMFERASTLVLQTATDLPLAQVTRHFFRTSVNVTKSMGLCAATAFRRGDLDQVRVCREQVDRTLIVAIEARGLPKAHWSPRQFLRASTFDRKGTLSEVVMRKEYHEYLPSHAIREYMVQAEAGSSAACSELIKRSVSSAVPGQPDDLIARFDVLFPRAR